MNAATIGASENGSAASQYSWPAMSTNPNAVASGPIRLPGTRHQAMSPVRIQTEPSITRPGRRRDVFADELVREGGEERRRCDDRDRNQGQDRNGETGAHGARPASVAMAAPRDVVLANEPTGRGPAEPPTELVGGTAGGEHDNRRLSRAGETFSDCEPVDARQEDIKQDELWPKRVGGNECALAVGRLADHREPVGFEEPTGEAPEARVIVDDEHRPRHAPDHPHRGSRGVASVISRNLGMSSMRVGRARPRLATMMTPTILRVGAIVAVLSVIGQVIRRSPRAQLERSARCRGESGPRG